MNEDHDLLLTFKAEVSTKLDRVISDVKELKDNVAARVSALEEEKLNQKEFQSVRADAEKLHSDHEKRLRRLERWGFISIGALGLIEIVLNLYANFHK